MKTKKCPYCGEPALKDSIPARFSCNRLRDLKSTDRSRIHKNCLEIEAKTTEEL